MSKDYLQQIDSMLQQAVAELTGMIKQRYPTASFELDQQKMIQR
jgi:hypothetical protein